MKKKYQNTKTYRFYIMKNIETNEYKLTSLHDTSSKLPNLKSKSWELISYLGSAECSNRTEYINYKNKFKDILKEFIKCANTTEE